jgi:hypothetical protein
MSSRNDSHRYLASLYLVVYRTLDKVDEQMAAMQEQRDIANEIAEAISNPVNMGLELDEVSHIYCCLINDIILTYQLIGRPQGAAGRVGAGNAERAVERSRSCASASTTNSHEAERQ